MPRFAPAMAYQYKTDIGQTTAMALGLSMKAEIGQTTAVAHAQHDI